MLIVTSDSGFCGGFNANVLREAEALRGLLKSRGMDAIPFVAGRKGVTWHTFRDRRWAGSGSASPGSPPTPTPRRSPTR